LFQPHDGRVLVFLCKENPEKSWEEELGAGLETFKEEKEEGS